jgi:muramoyltetrapeptide carboxypeptidase LdcA involved in peptidoglycan recycling
LTARAARILASCRPGPADPSPGNLDIGHTDPHLVFPLGVEVAIDCDTATMTATEPAAA